MTGLARNVEGLALKPKLFWVAAALMMLGMSTAMATRYELPLNQYSAGSLTVTGTITTDGTIGVLGSTDIKSWDLNVSGLALTPGNSSFILSGGDLSATTSGWLYFDVGDTSSPLGTLKFFKPQGYVEWQADGESGYFGSPYVRTAGLLELAVGSSGPYDSYLFAGGEFSPSDYWPLASEVAATTPLPAALPLFATGLGALGLLGWRRKRKAQTLAA